MPVQNSAGCRGDHVGQDRQKLPDGPRVIECRHASRHPRIAVIRQRLPDSSQPILESDQALVVQIGASEIDPLGPSRFALLDELPKEERHTAQVVKPLIGTAVFVNYRGSVP